LGSRKVELQLRLAELLRGKHQETRGQSLACALMTPSWWRTSLAQNGVRERAVNRKSNL
jgi:hypothetical protein